MSMRARFISEATEISAPSFTKSGTTTSTTKSKKVVKGTDSASLITEEYELLTTPDLGTLDEKPSDEKKLRFGTEVLTSKKMRLEQSACPKTCEHFLKIEEFANIFVNHLIEEAELKCKGLKEQSSLLIVEGLEYRKSCETTDDSSICSAGTYVIVLEWPTIGEFTPMLGSSKINEYISYWKMEEDWKYCIDYLLGESDETCDYHRYEVIFSIPCKQYPIPQATASVYFTFEISRVKPKHCLTDIYYSFEGQRLVHTPGKFKFQEVWLFNIIDAKINFYKKLTF